MPEHPIEGLMKTTMDNLKEMIDVNTIVGDPVPTQGGGVIIPISKVSVGFGSGGSEFNANMNNQSNQNNQNNQQQGNYPFGGGSAAGMSVQPVAFLVVNNNQVRLLPINQQNSIERLIDNVPDLMDNIFSMFKKDKHEEIDEENFNPS